jgi:hypothetical protein
VVREGGQIGERRKSGVEGGNVRAVYLGTLSNVAKANADELSAHLVEGEYSVVDIPVLYVYLPMRSVRDTIDRDLDLFGTLLSSPRTNLSHRGQ